MTENDNKYFNISFANKGCWDCLFLNCSDMGEDCRILKHDIQEDLWSNIGFQSDENWRYSGCPLVHHENIDENANILRIEEFVEWKCGG